MLSRLLARIFRTPFFYLFLVSGLFSPLLRAVQVSVTVSPPPGDPDTSWSYRLVIDQNGEDRYVGGGNVDAVSGRTNGFNFVPAGDGYRFRIIVGASHSGTFIASGKVLDVIIKEDESNEVVIPCSVPSVRLVEKPVEPIPAGSWFPLAFEITDASDFYEDGGRAELWGESDENAASGYVTADHSTRTAIAVGQVHRVGADLYRVAFEKVPGPPSAGTAYYSFGMDSYPSGSVAVKSDSILKSGTSIAQRADDPVEFSAPKQGFILTSSPGQWIDAVVDDVYRRFVFRASGPSPLRIGLPPSETVRLRYYTEDREGRLLTGKTVPIVPSTGFAEVSLSYEPWSLVPSPSNPPQVVAGQNYTLKFTMTDAGLLFENASGLQLTSVAEEPSEQDPQFRARVKSITVLDPRTSEVVFDLQAPPIPGKELLQVEGLPRLSWGTDRKPAYYAPDRRLGDAPIAVEIAAIQTGLDITISEVPAAANRVTIDVSGPNFRSVQSIEIVDGVARITLGVPPGAGYRVRAIAGDAQQTPQQVLSIGAVEDVSVPWGQIVPMAVALVVPRVSRALDASSLEPINPRMVAKDESYSLSIATSGLKGFFYLASRSLRLDRFASGVSDSTFLPTSQGLTEGGAFVAYEVTPSAATAPAVLSHDLSLPLTDFVLPLEAALPAPTLRFSASENDLLKIDLVPGMAPAFTAHPQGGTLPVGGGVYLYAEFAAAPQASIEWRKNGVPLVNPTTATGDGHAGLFLDDVQIEDAGGYTVALTNSFGTVTSSTAAVVVRPVLPPPIPPVPPLPPPPPLPAPSRLMNMSIRARSGVGDDTLIVGFVVGRGEGQKSLLVRGMGPSLAKDVPQYLANPMLTLYEGEQARETNDDWGGSEALVKLAERVGAFEFVNNSSTDAALALSDLSPNLYTAHVQGSGSSTGETLAEIYDADVDASGPRLMNLSARVMMRNASEPLIAGFVIGGSEPKKVLIRTIGPGLAHHDVIGFMPDPQLTLYRDKQVVGANDNWSFADISEIIVQVGAQPLDEGSKDAALVAILQPGLYTVHATGVNGSTGIVLIEVYDVE